MIVWIKANWKYFLVAGVFALLGLIIGGSIRACMDSQLIKQAASEHQNSAQVK